MVAAGHYVGRIGALAIALGVSSAITATCGMSVASADATAPEAPGATSASAPASAPGTTPSAGSAPRRVGSPRSSPRRDVAVLGHADQASPAPGPAANRDASPQEQSPAPARSEAAPSRGTRVRARTDVATRPATLPAPAASQTSSPVARASAAPATDPVTAFFSGVAALFNNQTPRLTPAQSSQAADGVISGQLNAVDPDSPYLSYAVTANPTRGSAVINADGTYTYTPNPSMAPAMGAAAMTDTFRVTVSDAPSGFAIHGLAGLVHLLSFGLFGERGDSSTATVTVTVAPFTPPNRVPTGTARITGTDAATGVVTGAVLGSDPDGDPLTYAGSATTGKGAVVVAPAGDFTYTPTDAARQAAAAAGATAAERSDTFTVTIDDGRGGTVALPVTVPIGAVSELSTFCGCTLMPADTVFHADVSTLPVLAKSDTWTDLLGGTLLAAWGGEPWMGVTAGMPVNVVGPDRPTETVIFNRGYSTSGPSIDSAPYAIPDYPLVEGMPGIPAWDRHLLVFQEGTCISQELYNVANGVEMPANSLADALGNAVYANLYGSAWIAEAGVRFDMSSPLYPAIGAANAARLPYLPLILRPDELERGSIDHMLGVTIAKDRGTGFTWPALAGDGTGTNPDGVPMGTVFRLRADFDVSDFDPATQVVLRALQQHGAVVYDSFNAGQDGMRLLAMSNGWTGTDYLTAQRELSTIPVGAFEAVDVLSIAADPSTGWMISSSA